MIGKFKFRTHLVLAAAVLLASCSQDEVMTNTGHDGLVPVTLSAAVGDGVQTRSAPDGEAKRCKIQILEKNGEGWQNAVGVETNPIDMEQDVDNPAQFTLTGVMLNPDKEYTFLFWADEDKDSYDASDWENVKIVNGDATNIAWQGKAGWKKDMSTTITANLTHAVTKVTLNSTTVVESGRPFVLSNLTEYNGFDVMNGTANGEIVTPGHKGTGIGASGDLLSFYALVTGENQELKLTSGEGGGVVSIPNVPLAPNTHVILKGDVQGAGWTTVNFTASVAEDWGSTATEIIGLEIADDGTYIVSSPAALQAWATAVQSNPSLNCTLADNITLPEVTDGGSNWTIVGTYTGTFDGAGYAITGLTGTAGFFDKIDINGVVKNLRLENVEITESGYGAIARESSGTIIACSVSGSVAGSSNSTTQGVGGIVGRNSAGTVYGCSMKGTVTNSGMYVGGIVGYCSGGNVIDCHSSATVTGTADVGGVVGKQYGINAKVIASSSTGDVTATRTNDNSYVGGVVGHANGGFIICCYATGNISGQHQQVGGVVGYNASTIIACYHAEGNVSGTGHVSGVVGYNGRSTITACYWSNDVDNGIGTDETNVGEATKVSGKITWTDAMNAMNAALISAGTGWQYVTGSGDAPLTLQKQ